MIGLGIGNLFVGPISDSLGRKTFNYRYDHFTLASLESYLFITYGL